MNISNELDISAQTLADKAYVSIKELIMSYAFKPGEILSEIELARRLEMSRTPIHQALLHLQRDGFLESASKTGWKVYSLSLTDIKEIFAVKIAVEKIIMEEAAMQNKLQKKSLLALLEKMRKAASERDLDHWIELDHELHDKINALATNSRAVQLSETLSEQLYRFQSRYPPLDLNQRQEVHEKIVNCIISGDATGAQTNHEKGLKNLMVEMEYVLQKIVFPLTNDLI